MNHFAFQLYSMNLVEKAKELKLEQRKSDAILFQMLPTSVAIRLKQTGKVRTRWSCVGSDNFCL